MLRSTIPNEGALLIAPERRRGPLAVLLTLYVFGLLFSLLLLAPVAAAEPLADSVPEPAERSDAGAEPFHADSAQRERTPRAFRPPSTEAAREAATGMLIVFAIATTGLVAFLCGAAYFYSPKSWRQPFRPTPPPQRKDRDTLTREDEYGEKDRWDIEADLGDYFKEIR